MLHAQIKIAGRLDPQWADWFDGLEISMGDSGRTILRGFLPDQSAVFGIIARLSSLGMTLISINIQTQSNRGKER